MEKKFMQVPRRKSGKTLSSEVSHAIVRLFSNSVARWLSPKLANSCHAKLLDPAKKHATNFQLKLAKNSEIQLKKLLFLRCLK